MNTLRSLLYIAVFTTVIVLVWIVLTIYHNNVTSTISQDTSQQITPLNPTFDAATIDSLANRTYIPVDLSQNSPLASQAAVLPKKILTPTPTPAPTQNLTPTPTKTTSNIPSPSSPSGGLKP